MEDSPIGLDKWLPEIWMVANCKNGISSYEMARALGITQKSAWFMDHRIRFAQKTGSFIKTTGGEFEADESFVGGLSKNMHKDRRERVIGKARGHSGKEAVMGILRRTDTKHGKSKVTMAHIPDVKRETLHAHVRENVEAGSKLYTDAWTGYRGLAGEYDHEIIDHVISYVAGAVYTNGIENFWSLLKRTIKGTYVSVEPFHLGRYLDEQSWRFNERELNDGQRFRKMVSSVTGRRITYAELTGANVETDKPN